CSSSPTRRRPHARAARKTWRTRWPPPTLVVPRARRSTRARRRGRGRCAISRRSCRAYRPRIGLSWQARSRPRPSRPRTRKRPRQRDRRGERERERRVRRPRFQRLRRGPGLGGAEHRAPLRPGGAAARSIRKRSGPSGPRPGRAPDAVHPGDPDVRANRARCREPEPHPRERARPDQGVLLEPGRDCRQVIAEEPRLDPGRVTELARSLEAELARLIVGQKDLVRDTVIALIGGGHTLLEGVPGLGKTVLVRSLGQALKLSFARIQFTPDLMPADIVGTNVIREEKGRREF